MKFYKNHKSHKLQRLKNAILNFLNLMLQSLHGQLADVCVAFIILTISHHHHLPSNHLCIADILVASSMFLFFDSIIQNYFTGIKIVYINYGFFLQLPIYIYMYMYFGKHCR